MTVGDVLRARREELGITLDEAAMATNVRARMLATLEATDFASYPPHGHAVGMLSSYARYLEMDPHPILEQYESEYLDYVTNEEMATIAERTRRGVGRFGEQVNTANRPITREAARNRRSPSRTGASAQLGSLSSKLSDERSAEADERYTTGSVKVVARRTSPDAPPPRRSSRASRATGAAAAVQAATPAQPAVQTGATGTQPGVTGSQRPSVTGSVSRGSTGSISRGSTTGSLSRASTTGPLQRTPTRRGQGPAATSDDSRYHSGTLGEVRPVGTSASPAASGRFTRTVDIDENLSSDQREALSYFGAASDQTGPVAGTAADLSGTRLSDLEVEEVAPERSEPGESGPDAERGERQSREGGVREAIQRERPRLIVLAFAIIAVAAVILAVVLITTSGSSNTGVLEVSGGADSTASDSATATVSTSGTDPVTITVEVASGEASLISITYDEDSAYKGTAVGPWEREFTVSESFSATVGNPDAVTITQDGTEVDMDLDDDGNGTYTLLVNNASDSSASSSSSKSSKNSKKSKKSDDDDE